MQPRSHLKHSIADLAGRACQVPPVGEHVRVFVLPGGIHASATPTQITTTLGSCVAICLWDAKLRIGGMNHFLLPSATDPENDSLRYGDRATHALLQRLAGFGGNRRNLSAKLFGGAALFKSQQQYQTSLGAQNVAKALALMESARIPVLAQDTGGDRGRKLVFNTDDGSAWSRVI
jgi:chemotaxis protein CheD